VRFALVELRPGPIGQRAFFTEAGLNALRLLLQDRRAMDPGRFAHLRRELGLDAPDDTATGAGGPAAHGATLR
jgi:hypothetical protein